MTDFRLDFINTFYDNNISCRFCSTLTPLVALVCLKHVSLVAMDYLSLSELHVLPESRGTSEINTVLRCCESVVIVFLKSTGTGSIEQGSATNSNFYKMKMAESYSFCNIYFSYRISTQTP